MKELEMIDQTKHHREHYDKRINKLKFRLKNT